jgi:hypothetical protein
LTTGCKIRWLDRKRWPVCIHRCAVPGQEAESVAVATKPEATKGVLKLLGDPRSVDRDLQVFRRSARVLSSRDPRLIDRYAKQWVAVYQGKVCAQGKTLRSLLAQVDKKGLPRERLIVRFIDKTQRTMIL